MDRAPTVDEQSKPVTWSNLRLSSPLHKACRKNDFQLARKLMKEVHSTRGAEALKRMLKIEDSDGNDPLRLACDAAGESDTGDSRLKLLLLDYVVELDMVQSIFSHGKHLLLPQLGALIVLNPGSQELAALVQRKAQQIQTSVNSRSSLSSKPRLPPGVD